MNPFESTDIRDVTGAGWLFAIVCLLTIALLTTTLMLFVTGAPRHTFVGQHSRALTLAGFVAIAVVVHAGVKKGARWVRRKGWVLMNPNPRPPVSPSRLALIYQLLAIACGIAALLS
ncbi:MAG: hypothetical protein AAGD14_01400 [Planctomycetota bacterium]